MAKVQRRGVLGLLFVVLALTGCSSSGPNTPTIQAARTFKLVHFTPSAPVAAGQPVTLSFRIQQPSGKTLTRYRRGPGPHTGIHLIIVRDDLAHIVHRHPPIAADGSVTDSVPLRWPGPYRVLVDAYPDVKGAPRNFQLHDEIRVTGHYAPRPVPRFSRTRVVDGYRFTYLGPARIAALTPSFARVVVARPDGSPARFAIWFGAYGHAIFFRQGSLDYFHTHVCGRNTPGCTTGARVSGRSGPPGKLSVGILLTEAGTWRMFLQAEVDGRILTAPFTLTAT